MKSYTISLGGQTFQIKSDASDEHVKNLAAYVGDMYASLDKRGPRASQDLRAMAMVAIMLADELFEARLERDHVKGKARDFARAMIHKIDEMLSVDKS